jgi:O-antigen/teichoic acid export membrane protein
MLYGLSRHRIIATLRIAEGLANLTLSVVLVQFIGLVGVALGTAISHIVVVLLILPLKACKVMTLDLGAYYRGVYGRPLLTVLPFAMAAIWVDRHHPPADLPTFLIEVTALVMFYAVCVFFFALDRPERLFVRRILKPWAVA